jgi:peptide deformylase
MEPNKSLPYTDPVFEREGGVQQNILIWPNDKLSTPSRVLETVDEKEKQLLCNMRATIKAQHAIGVSAIQLGYDLRMFVIDMPEEDSPIAFINPTIVETSETMFTWEEGCLSIPGYFKTQKRSNMVVIKYLDSELNERDFEFQGLYAFAILHEMEHLDGILFIDDFSKLKKSYIKKKVQNATKYKT